MAFSRATVDAVGGFDESLGAGTRCGSGEDTDFLFRVSRKGLKIVYAPDLVVYHNHGRRTEEEAVRLRRNYAVGRGSFYCKHVLAGDREGIQLLAAEVSSYMRATISVAALNGKWLYHIGIGVAMRLFRRG